MLQTILKHRGLPLPEYLLALVLVDFLTHIVLRLPLLIARVEDLELVPEIVEILPEEEVLEVLTLDTILIISYLHVVLV